MDLTTKSSNPRRLVVICVILTLTRNVCGAAEDVPTINDLSIIPQQKIKFGNNATFICNVSGNPVPTIQWMKDNLKLNSSSKYQITNLTNGGMLLVQNLERDDTASYTCFTYNSAGNVSKAVNLTVLAPPDPPYNITNKTVTATSVVIQWKAGLFDGNTPVRNFTIEIKRPGTNFTSVSCVLSVHNESCVVTNKTEVTVTGLRPCSDYDFQICSSNDIGQTCSVRMDMRTAKAAPGIPSNLTVRNSSSQSLLVSWDAPTEANECLRGYQLIWRLVENDKQKSVPGGITLNTSLPYNALKHNITGLCSYCLYKVSLQAKSNVYGSEFANDSARTDEDKPTKPLNLRALTPSTGTLLVEWNEPNLFNGILIGYSIDYKNIRDDHNAIANYTEWEHKKSSYLNITLSNLCDYCLYAINVTASTSKGKGNITSGHFRTKEAVPGKPNNFAVSNNKLFSKINLSWSGPSDPNGNITGYYVTWRMEKDDRNESVESSLNEALINGGTATSFCIENLDAFSLYNVSINAINNAGNGSKASQKIRSGESLPDKPGAVEVKVNSTSLSVKWTKPDHPRGIVLEYNVSWVQVTDDHGKPLENQRIYYKILEATVSFYTITNLEPHSLYNISVSAATKAGEGQQVFTQKMTGQSGYRIDEILRKNLHAGIGWLIVKQMKVIQV